MIPLLSVALPLALGVCSDPYIRTRADSTTCPTVSQAHCLHWPAGSVVYNQSQTGDPLNPATDGSVFLAITQSWQSWQTILDACGDLTLSEGPRVPDRAIGYQQGGTNLNLVLFRTRSCSGLAPPNDPCQSSGDCNNKYDCWDKSINTIALTTTTYEKSTGKILDADMELNAAQFKFTTVDSPRCPSFATDYNCVATDIRNTATHEFGHSLGLDHTNWIDPVTHVGSTMSPTANTGDTDKRAVDSGSQQFICTAYPKGAPSQDCVNQSQSSGGCSSARGSPLLIALAAWLLILRRKRAARAFAP